MAEAEDRLTLPQFRMPLALSSRGTTKLVALAEQLRAAPTTAMRMVGRLITAGLTHRRLNPANRRETLLELTGAGRLVVENVTARRHQEIASIVERLAPERRAALVEALAAFNEAGVEPAATAAGSPAVCPLGWADAPAAHVL